MKASVIYGAIAVVVIGLIAKPFIIKTKEDKIIKEAMSKPEGIPTVEWDMLYKLDYKTGKAPDDLKQFDGKFVKIPGFVVPLSDNFKVLDEFLLVPDAQSCIHVPPPPPNLIVHTTLRNSIPIEESYNPAWIYGILKIETTESIYGKAGFTLDAVKMERFDY
tara:strand:- start:6484 stop:6969 length:486 start_codon:yes stop_codon:yes gene_type:complete